MILEKKNLSEFEIFNGIEKYVLCYYVTNIYLTSILSLVINHIYSLK